MIRDAFSADELKGFYHQPFWDVRKKISRQDFEKYGCVIYGAGVEGKLVTSSLRGVGLEPICFIDRNPLLSGKRIDGVMVCQPSELDNYASSYIIVSTCRIRSILTDNQFLIGKKVVLWSALDNFCSILPVLPDKPEDILDNREAEDGFSLLKDEKSKKIFRDFIKFQLDFCEDLFQGEKCNGYFPTDINLNYRVFVDAGAADGDTLQCWLKAVETLPEEELYYYAFEPNQFLFHRISEYVSHRKNKISSKIELYNFGLGESDSIYRISNAGKSSSIIPNTDPKNCYEIKEDNSTIRITCLDNFKFEHAPTFIKADIEGSELSLLRGSEALIHSTEPDLAISVYHKYEDIWKIPLLINKIDKNYNFYLRHSTHALDDVILFATCKNI